MGWFSLNFQRRSYFCKIFFSLTHVGWPHLKDLCNKFVCIGSKTFISVISYIPITLIYRLVDCRVSHGNSFLFKSCDADILGEKELAYGRKHSHDRLRLPLMFTSCHGEDQFLSETNVSVSSLIIISFYLLPCTIFSDLNLPPYLAFPVSKLSGCLGAPQPLGAPKLCFALGWQMNPSNRTHFAIWEL